MSKFAEGTEVSAEKSRAEIETLLRRYGADQFVSGWDAGKAQIGFRVKERFVKFVLPLPDPSDKAFTHQSHHSWKVRSAESATKAYEQAIRQRWRALALVVKAKLEAVETGITTFEEEFMAHIVMPDGKTVGEHARPWIEDAYNKKQVPALMGW